MPERSHCSCGLHHCSFYIISRFCARFLTFCVRADYNNSYQLINTTFEKQAIMDSYSIRRTSLVRGIPYCKTIQGAFAVVNGIRAGKGDELSVIPLQDY